MKTLVKLILSALLICLISCRKKKPNLPLGNTNVVTSFSIRYNSSSISCIIGTDDTIRGTMPIGTSLNSLVPDITHNGKTISPASGIATNFSTVVTYLVTSESGSIKKYFAKIVVDRSEENKILSFTFNSPFQSVSAAIDNSNHKLLFRFSPSVRPDGQKPAITISPRATIAPASGVAQNFSNSIVYNVIAENNVGFPYYTELQKPDFSIKDVPTPPKYLCIYYAWPSVVNLSNGNINTAISFFIKYDILVFGGGLWEATHGDNIKTKQIIAGLKAQKPGIKIFGYIDVGVSPPPAQNLTIAQLQTAIDGWQQMGVQGVFGDDFGMDFGVDRARQNAFIDYAHSKGLSVFANSFYVYNALGGNDCKLSSVFGDYYLIESFLESNGVYTNLDNNIKKADSAYYYMKTKGVGIACVSYLPTVSANSNSSAIYQMAWHGTAMYNFDAFQLTDKNYSSQSAQVYYYQNPIASYGSGWLQWDWVKRVSATRYERSTSTNIFFIEGDGATFGTGGH